MSSEYTINRTEHYHIHELDTLGWELTVCNAMEPSRSPIRSILQRNDTFGHILYDYLLTIADISSVKRTIEIGGGYGFLMRDFIDRNPGIEAVMLDISPFLLGKQRESLSMHNAEFIQSDFFSYDEKHLQLCDLAILNENMGDFPTVCGLDPEYLQNEPDDMIKRKVKDFFDAYSLQLPVGNEFNFNLGACEAIERLCRSNIRYIYAGEHSCEAELHGYPNSIRVIEQGNPEVINLRGHREYTVKFSHLQKIAQSRGYRALRGRFIDFIKLIQSDKLNFIMNSHVQGDEHEMIRQFVEDLYKYEYLFLIKQ